MGDKPSMLLLTPIEDAEDDGLTAKLIARIRNAPENRAHLRSGNKILSVDAAMGILYKMKTGNGFFFLVVLNGSAVGYCGIGNYSDLERRGELYTIVDPQYAAYEEQIGRMLLDHCFKDRDMHRVDAVVYGSAPSRMALVESLGFTNEGCRKSAHYWGGVWVDEHVYGRVNNG